ncbi:hypothetical protein ACOMHN_018239 [Nucella lapillus]
MKIQLSHIGLTCLSPPVTPEVSYRGQGVQACSTCRHVVIRGWLVTPALASLCQYTSPFSLQGLQPRSSLGHWGRD